MITVMFANGKERQYAAATASLEDHGRLFVLYKQKDQRLESADTFPANQIAWARLENGNIVLGRGQVKSK